MPKKYKIRDGFTFRGDDGQTAGGGDMIELDDDVAELHAHKLELVEDPAKRRAQPKQPVPVPLPDGSAAADVQNPATGDQGAAQSDQPADQQ
jgi:hypothetical protein